MKKLQILFLLILFGASLHSQEITGQWNGLLKVQNTELNLVFHIEKTTNGYQSTMDSPDQGAHGIPVETTSYSEGLLKIKLPNLMIEYVGRLENNQIVGDFKQGGTSFPLNLSREMPKKEIVLRPQEPKAPFPYSSEEILFENPKAQIQLAGTLTLPQQEGKCPAVVLITGSGAQNRDEELFGHKPFLVLADHLTRNGIAVLRYDDRCTAQSEGDFNSATSVDLADDADAAINYLRSRNEIDKKQIGLIGHSEGGLIAPMLAAKSKDIAFIVLLAGPGMKGADLILLQQALLAKAAGIDEVSKFLRNQ